MFLACRLGHVEVKISVRNTDGKSVAGIHQLFRKEALDQAAVSVNMSPIPACRRRKFTFHKHDNTLEIPFH